MIISFRNGGGSGGGVTTGEVQTMIDASLAGYYTSGQTDSAIDDAVSGKADTSALTEYYTSGETDAAISNAISDINFDKLESVSAFPQSANTGDVVALEGGAGLPLGIIFEERTDLGANNNKAGGRFNFPVNADYSVYTQDSPLFLGNFTTTSHYTYGMYLAKDEYSSDVVFYLSSDGNLYDPDLTISMGIESSDTGDTYSFDTIITYHYTQSTDEYMVIDMYPETTGEVGFDDIPTGTPMGVYQYDGSDWESVKPDMSAYWTSAETQTAINTALGTVNNQLESI